MKRVALVLGVLLVVVVGVGFLAMRSFRTAAAAAKPAGDTHTVARGDITVQVVETGTVDSVKAVEVKSRVGGRVARLLVDEGDLVNEGDLIAVIDPQETELRVEQDRAQLRGAESALTRSAVEIEQRLITSRTAVDRARARVAQLRKELEAQPTLTRTAIRASETQLATAQQSLKQLREATLPNARSNADASVQEAQLQLDNANREVTRRQGLLAKGFISEREMEDARLNQELAMTRLRNAQDQRARLGQDQNLQIRQAEERVAAAEADLQRARANSIQDDIKQKELDTALASLREAEVGLRDVEVLRASRAQSQATVDQLRSSLGDSLRQLGETEIRAPVTGVISRRLIQEGELVTSLGSFSSGTPIVRLEDRSRMRVKLQVNEIDVARLRLGMKADVEIDAIPNVTFKGEVDKISPSSESIATGQASADPVVKYAVEIQLDRPDERLKSGMTAKCTVVTLRRPNVVRIPEEYLGKDEKGTFVMLAPATTPASGSAAAKADSKAQGTRTAVTVGASAGGYAEILDGIKEGAKLVKPEFKGPARRGAQFGPDDE